MTSPLVSRPPYGEGRPRMPLAESGLPQGGPADRGLPLDDGIPGTKTFVKPLDDNGTVEPKDESIYRVESPREMGKDRDRIDVVDLSESSPSFMTQRDASAGYVLARWLLAQAPERTLLAGARVAATMGAMLTGLNPEFLQKAQTCSVTMKRADIPNLRWIFAVDCGNGVKVVRVKASRVGNATQFAKLDLHVACSCPAWRWLGPEFHSTTKDYQDPKTPLQGTASTPNIRDPERKNLVCKHVAAVLSFTKTWAIPKPKK